LRGYTGVATRDGSDVSSIGDRAGALVMLQRNKEKLAEVKTALCDGGYTGKSFAEGASQRSAGR
jgi:hypothetical protein